MTPSLMEKGKMTITWDDLTAEAVEEKLRQVEAVTRAQEQYRSAPPPDPLLRHNRRSSVFYNTAVYMCLFGLLGGLLGWAGGTMLQFRGDPRGQAIELSEAIEQLRSAPIDDPADRLRTAAAIQSLHRAGRDNPYFTILQDESLSEQQRIARTNELVNRDWWKQFISDLLFHGLCGMTIAIALGMADPIIERNRQQALINGSIAAAMGLCGGLVAALFLDSMHQWLATTPLLAHLRDVQPVFARAVSWGVLGLFLSAAPGIAMRSGRRLMVGLLGGLIGGIVGGLVFDPILSRSGSLAMSRLAAIIAIGAVTGLATGLIENIARSGWLRVSVGLIAGKQFVLYRNPTYIGSAPQCQIFLFKDPQVGRRHAAVHVMPGGFEIEDLPLGGKTLVNGRAIARTRLRNGDRVQVGATTFTFEEKAKTA